MLSKTYEIASVVIPSQRRYDTVSTADDLIVENIGENC
jgi:hypothetical protein